MFCSFHAAASIILVMLLLSACSRYDIVEFESVPSSQPKQTNNSRNTPIKKPNIKLAKLQAPIACIASVMQPAKFRTVKRKILTFEGSYNFSNTPLGIKTKVLRLQVHPPRHAIETEPAVYRTVVEKIKTLRVHSQLRALNPIYRKADREYITKPPYQRWKADCMPRITETTDPETQAQRCIETVPARRQNVARRLIETPPQTHKQVFDTQILKIRRKEIVKPGKGHGGIIPAQYRDITIYYIDKPSKIKTQATPSHYQTLSIDIPIHPASLLQRPTLCEDRLTTQDVMFIQRALRRQGGQITSINGKMDQETRRAILAYQRKQGLPVGALTLDTLIRLGFGNKPAKRK